MFVIVSFSCGYCCEVSDVQRVIVRSAVLRVLCAPGVFACVMRSAHAITAPSTFDLALSLLPW